MKRNMLQFDFRVVGVRILLLISVVLCSVGVWGAATYDFEPTAGGLVVNLKSGDQILLSTWVDVNSNGVEDDGEEFFVCHYPDYTTGSYFGYTNWDSNKGNFLKLVPQDADATEPASPSIWRIDDPVTFRTNGGIIYPWEGIAYTMWSTNPNGDSYTLRTSDGNAFRFQGDLTREANHPNICNAIFVVPTNRPDKVISFDPNNTMRRGTLFDGEKGYGFLGLPYREVYWLDIPRGNGPYSYTNASVVGFNKTLSTIQYSNNEASARPGQALYAFGNKDKHHKTPRTIFRLYVLNDPLTSTCADSYYFAYDEQDVVKYNKNFAVTPATYTTEKKIYTIDHLVCMDSLPGTKYYVSDWMNVPVSDNTYYYVGYKNKYCHTSSGDAFDSYFKKIETLPVWHLGLPAPRGAYGRMVVDTTQTSAQNLDVAFNPGGYFLRTSSGRNIRLRPNEDGTIWTCEEMWHITEEYANLFIKATMFTGSEFDEHDEGADIPGWSVMVRGTEVPVTDGRSIIDCDGWARIHVDNASPNGAIEFVPANPDRHIHYDNNSFVGNQIPDQYPMHNETSVVVREPRLVGGFEFHGWNKQANGSGKTYLPGDTINLSEGLTTLYAQAEYTGTIHVALSFKKDDGKRYFLTHPGTAAPRFSRARYIKDWTNAWQGMANADNVDDNYLNTFKVLTHPNPCSECGETEVVLDPRREMRHGAIDSLEFYEHFAPDAEEYIGLYYTTPNTILANNSWAGLFMSSATGGRNGWPDYTVADVKNAKLSSTHYLHRVDGNIKRDERSNSSAPWIKYNAADNQFDGDAFEANATVFQISRVRVADEHYVVIPDTTTAWTDEIVFGIHEDEKIEQPVWSKLIGKQLMAVTKVDDDTVYFHPNLNKIITEYTQMRLNSNYRLDESFDYIRDARVDIHTLEPEDTTSMNDRLEKNYFGRLITSGKNTPVDVIYEGNYIDIVDTLRITLRTLGPVKIKEYYGRWKKGAPGLHIRPDGSRYRDILVRTKTVHHGDIEVKLKLTPEYPTYNFSPLADASKRLNFTLAKVRSRQLLDTEGNVLGEEILDSEDVTSALQLGPGNCSFVNGYFKVNEAFTTHATLATKTENTSGARYDTLVINSTAEVDGITYPVKGRVPLMQSALAANELIWSAEAGGKRYFIMAGSGGLIFRQYELKGGTGGVGGTLYKKEDGKTQLVKGSANDANSDTKYITPWLYTYVDQAQQQRTLKTDAPVNMYFVITGTEETPGVAVADSTTLTYVYDTTYVNSNANYEEQVRIRYGDPETGKWLKLDATPALTLTTNSNEATVFSWTYLQQEYNLLNNGAYPNKDQLEFGYNSTAGASVQTRYKAYRIYSMLLNNKLTYCGREDENDISDLISDGGNWKTNYSINLVSDSRFSAGASGLTKSTNAGTLTTTVTPAGDSPKNIQYGGKYVNIVDTLDVQISLQSGAPTYRFADKWKDFISVDDAHLKIPLIRRTYHTAPYDSLICYPANDEHYFVFPPEVSTGVNDEHTFTLHTDHRTGTNTLNVDGKVVSYTGESHDHTDYMHLDEPAYAEIRLMDEKGNAPDWCKISELGTNTIKVHCLENGIRAPRSASLYIAYAIEVNGRMRFINFRLQVMQSSRFQYGNQNLVHSKGASGDDLKDGVQQVHENKNVLYYYNPSNAAKSTDQRVELPIRERNFYGWWRWYSLEEGKEDTDIPAERWETAPTNTGKWNFPFRVIGDSVWNDPEDHSKGKKLVTQGRYTVFHVPSQDYGARKDPPAKAPMLYPPQNKAVERYAVDLSVYYDNLPLSMKDINQVDINKLDTMTNIIEPTLSLREIYELHPWTEMAERLEGYKDTIASSYRNQKYMEDHVVRAPKGNCLLLTTEQRYNYDNIKKGQHSESLLGYYMRDDNWNSFDATAKDTMIWCGGWDVTCGWYTYNTRTQTYDTCTLPITEANDFLQVNVHGNIKDPSGVDTVIYCLRARSVKSTNVGTADEDNDHKGDYWFNICRYKILYHNETAFGPKVEAKVDGVDKAIITNDEIEQKFEVLERLNFDYNKPGTDYTVYPHPLPWGDASYGFAYPRTASLPDNRPHNKGGLTNLANMGEYNLINRIPSFGTYWHKMTQHGGAENGYMIFCDGMSSAGQVAALSLESHLCEGQRLYFSAYVGNPGNEKNKTCPNFLFAVQGSLNGADWEDITSYLTGDLAQSNKWYQIYFPIEQDKEYNHFRVRVYNMGANDDGNDFIIDDMCIFATKPPLMVYQANTTCKNENESDSLTHIVLRVDYQGFTEEIYASGSEFYTVQEITKLGDSTFVKLADGYYNEQTRGDTIFGEINLPNRHYKPVANDSIFANLQTLIEKFEWTLEEHEKHPEIQVFRRGYVFEHLDDSIRPVLYVVHSAKMSSQNDYVVHMAGKYNELMSSKCALTRPLKVRNRMILTLNGDEMPDKEIASMCANTTYDVSLHVKGTVLLNNTAPIEVTGSCYNDWLLYGDTAAASSKARYGYYYNDIVKVIKDILRADPSAGTGTTDNPNHLAHSLADVDKVVMGRVKEGNNVTLTSTDHPYDILAHLVNGGFLTLYQSNLTVITAVDDSIKYTIFPIPGTGSEVMQDLNIDVCPTPVHIKLASGTGQGVPMIIGGLNRSEEEAQLPITVLVDAQHANSQFAIPIDSLMYSNGSPRVVLKDIHFVSTNDPEFRDGVHHLSLTPDRIWSFDEGEQPGYYQNGNDTLQLVPSEDNNYLMREGYNYTFVIEMATKTGQTSWQAGDDCPIGTVPFIVSVVPNYLRWDPKSTENNKWNDADNWIGIDALNKPIHSDARFVPLASSKVVIPKMENGLPYPELPNPSTLAPADSVQKTGFQYNQCSDIRFLPGAAIGQQQRLSYENAIVDMSTPHQKWALRGAPVTGMLSGDLFMAEADLHAHSALWEVGEFDAHGRSYTTGTGSFWLSLYNRAVKHRGNGDNVNDTTYTADAQWSKVTNGMDYSLPAAQGWAVYSNTKSKTDADIRLPKHDDIFYYYYANGEKAEDYYVSGVQAKRDAAAGGSGKAGELAFYPGASAPSQDYTLTNEVASDAFVFANPSMGYIDIWGFIADNDLEEEIAYIKADGTWDKEVKATAIEGTPNTITNLQRYLPPMHAMVIYVPTATTEKKVTLNASRIVTSASQIVRSVPLHRTSVPLRKGIMTITAVNPVSTRCISRLKLGQGYNAEIIRGEDAMLTTVNINNYTNYSMPATPFNIYAVEGNEGLSIDLRDEIVNVPISFNMSKLPFDEETQLWFTGVNNISGSLVLFDSLTMTERPIMDGICLKIETPKTSHEKRYYIRRHGELTPDDPTVVDPIMTEIESAAVEEETPVIKIIRNGHVYILRNGHVYTTMGQQLR